MDGDQSLQVEKGVPIPRNKKEKTAARLAIETLHASDTGDSIFIPADHTQKRARDNITAKCGAVGGAHWATVRKVPGGYRIWKIA